MSIETIVIYENNHCRLRSITHEDTEIIRQWKNCNRESFCYKKIITVEQQEKWFHSFQKRADDHMFMTEERIGTIYKPFGVMGYRIKETHVDIYNIIRGVNSECQLCTMGYALKLMLYDVMCNYNLPIRCLVLRNNPAVSWYEKNGLRIISKHDNLFELEYLDNENSINYAKEIL